MGGTPTNSDPGSPGAVRLVIGSRFEELAQVHALIEDLGRRHGLHEDTVNALLVAVIEAGTNAIQHGNLFAADKSVRFEFTVDPRDVRVRVDDFGKGFDPGRVPNPTEGDQLLDPHGRGLFLMRSLMDEVSIQTRTDHGTTVLLRKARATSAGEGAPASA